MAYIDREVAKKVLAFGVGVTAANALDNVPAADVVEVVRCKDCKWYHDFEDCWDCNNPWGLDCVSPNDYCCLGKKKDGE